MANQLVLFFSYSVEDQELREKLQDHLASLTRRREVTYYDQKIGQSMESKGVIHEELERSKVIVPLISTNFLGSEYCSDVEMTRALEKHNAGEAQVIPVIIRPCDWQAEAPLAKLKVFPKNGIAVTDKRSDQEAAWADVAKSIRGVVEELMGKSLVESSQTEVDFLMTSGRVLHHDTTATVELRNPNRVEICGTNYVESLDVRIREGFTEAIAELKKLKQELDRSAQEGARRVFQILAGSLVVMFLVLIGLTVWLGWNLMEPLTFFFGFTGFVIVFLFFAIRGKEFSFTPTAIFNHLVDSKKRKNYQRLRIDEKKYQDLEKLEKELFPDPKTPINRHD